MTGSALIAACANIAAELDGETLEVADRAYSAAFFAAQDDASFRDAATAFVAAIVLCSAGWST